MITAVTVQMEGTLKLLQENSISFKKLKTSYPIDYQSLPEVSSYDLRGHAQRYREAYERMKRSLFENDVASEFEEKYESIIAIDPKKIIAIKTAFGKLIEPDTIQLTVTNDTGTDFIYRVIYSEIYGGPYSQTLRPSFISFEKLFGHWSTGIPKVTELLKQYGYRHFPFDKTPSILDKEDVITVRSR